MILTRFHKMEKLDLEVEFLTPTFLGGADQNGELRSPPFKNLFRQWWRVVNGHLDVDTLRLEEGRLFGTVQGDDAACASRVRFTVTPMEGFATSDNLPFVGTMTHREVQNGTRPMNRLMYLGYGPISPGKTVKFIEPGSGAKLSVMCPKQDRGALLQSVSLVHAFGALGGRSRNGFGSLSLSGPDGGFADLPGAASVQDFFAEQHPKKYPHGLARDQKGLLCWELRQTRNWQDAMKIFAELYRDVRLSFPFNSGNVLEKRHILGYPAGSGHKVGNWGGNNGRMPSQLRLMVKRDNAGKIVGRILHLPYLLPKPWDAAKLGSELDVWKQVHTFLDKRPELKRFGGAR